MKNPDRTTVQLCLSNGERVSRREGNLTRAQDPKDAVANTPVIYTRHAGRLRQHRPNGGLFIVGEFIPHDSSLPVGEFSNHDPGACLNSERLSPSEAKS
jgi:hypothetical protein